MANKEESIRTVVGDRVFEVWLAMLRELVPAGRTHRLAPIVAGMLQFATLITIDDDEMDPEGPVAWRFHSATETSDPGEVKELLLELVERMFEEAKVGAERKSAAGMRYSIAEEAIEEYIRWEYMPWE